MSRRAATVTQADVARAIRAAQQTGLTIVRIVVRKDGVSIETAANTSPLPEAEAEEDEPNFLFDPPAKARVDYLQQYYDQIGFDPKTMNAADRARLQAEAEAKWKLSVAKSSLNKRECDVLRQLDGVQPEGIVRAQAIHGLGPDTADRLQARGFIEPRYSIKFPDRIERWMLTHAGATAVQAMIAGREPVQL